MTGNQELPSAVFAQKVRQLRELCGWSQAELGQRLGAAGHPLGQARISMIEQTGSVTIDQAHAFAEVFNVPIEAMLYKHDRAPRGIEVLRVMAAADRLQEAHDELRRLAAGQAAD